MDKLEEFKGMNALVKLSGPIFVELFLQMLVGNVDQFMVGRYSDVGVAAIGNANQVLNIVIIVFSVISVAATIRISLYKGYGDNEKAQSLYSLSLCVNLVLSIVVSIILVVFSKGIFTLMNVPEEVLPQAALYLSLIGGFIALQGIHLTFTAILRSNAMMKESMLVSLALNVVNIGGNALLIPHLGLVGAAISSIAARLAGVVILAVIFKLKVDGRISLKYLTPFPWEQLKKLLFIGIPSGGESLSYTVSQLAIQTMANGFGKAVIVTKTYASMFAMISYLYTNALSQASQIIVGYLLGSGDEKNVRVQVKRTLILSITVSMVISILIFLCSRPIFGFFTDNLAIIELGHTIMFLDIFVELGRSVNMVMVRDLQAVGDIAFPITLGITCMWIIATWGGFMLGVIFNMGLAGFWIAMGCDECIRAVMFIIRWKSGRWKGKNLISE
ncbi:MATE family efflux transporter [Aminipila sp.]|uniref:MATE family efflux transporter n=1 Tax=Aminipila sp. TaxID=2060095 RepID=UPI002896BDA3|nr:MATE family efflux transporter [Aminipila sp.]